MTATGIGAPVRRKEDQRFITGKGHYTDDHARPAQTVAHFVRSPHAHAKLKRIDTKAAAAMPGVLAVYTGDDFALDKLGGLICGWTVHSKDGSPMKMAPHPALATGKVSYVGDAYAVVIAETAAQARDAAEKIVTDFEVLPAIIDPADAQKKGAQQIHEVAPYNTIYDWHIGDPDANAAAMQRAKHITRLDFINNRLVPNALEPRSAIAEYDPGGENFTLWTTSQNPHVARLVISAFIGVAPAQMNRTTVQYSLHMLGDELPIPAEAGRCTMLARLRGVPTCLDGGLRVVTGLLRTQAQTDDMR